MSKENNGPEGPHRTTRVTYHREVPVGSLPVGIEQALTVAAINPRFRQQFLEEPAGAAARRGIRLDPVEEALLASVDPDQLHSMIDRMVIPGEMSRRGFTKSVAASVMAMVCGGQVLAEIGCMAVDGGIGPEDVWDDDSADDFAAVQARQDWASLAGRSCYIYVPAALVGRAGRAAPLLVTLHGAGEDCLTSVQRWSDAADIHRLHLVSVNWDPDRDEPGELAAQLAPIAEAYCELHDVRPRTRVLAGNGAASPVVFRAAGESDPPWDGAILIGGLPAAGSDGDIAAGLSHVGPDLRTRVYHVIGEDDPDAPAARALADELATLGVPSHLEVLPGKAEQAMLSFPDIWRWLDGGGDR